MQRRHLLCFAASVWASAIGAQVPIRSEVCHALPSTMDIDGYVSEASLRFGLPKTWIYALISAESAGNMRAISHAGAMGLMQLMPATWARQRVRLGLGHDPFNARDNILAGTAYLREMYDSYGTPGFLAAYNAGPGRYREWRDKGRPLPAETRAYIAKIAPRLQDGSAVPAEPGEVRTHPPVPSWTHSALFSVRSAPQIASRTVREREDEIDPHLAAPPSPDPVFAPIARSKPQ